MIFKFIFFICIHLSFEQELLKVGCFLKDDVKNFEDSFNFAAGKSAAACVVNCRKLYKRFAGLYKGKDCLCGEYYGGVETDSCDKECQNGNETCGGDLAVSIYETNDGCLGAPTTIKVVNKTENSLIVNWNPPATDLSEILQYQVTVKPIFYFTELDPPKERLYKYSSYTQFATLDNLQPGTKYGLEVKAYSDRGAGYPVYIEGWTTVGTPLKPETPEILSKTDTTRVIHIQKVLPTGGPITYYQIVVVDQSIPVIFDHESLMNYRDAQQNRLPYYIAAEFKSDDFESTFTVGDNKIYNRYLNAPLKHGAHYHIHLGVISTINKTKSAYSDTDHSQHESSVLDFHQVFNHPQMSDKHGTKSAKSSSNGTVLGLSIAIGLFAFILVASILVYFALRVYFRKTHQRAADHQELAVHAHHPNQDYDNGYALSAHYVDDEELQPDHYRILREKVSVFPHQNIRIVGDLGSGKFGSVRKCVMANPGKEHSTVLVHQIPDNSLDSSNKQRMLKEFDDHIKIGSHQNLICLLGLMEDLHVISIVFEYETSPLKSQLEESRAVQHYPVYAEKNRRFSTLQESQLLNILIGIAKGMRHLSCLRIPHGQLSARNILIKDGVVPKVSGFGLVHFHNDVYIPDYRRWQSPEALQSGQPNCPSDIWSFGCLSWECVTLGGTPYAEIRTEDLLNRIVRGLRLPQPQYVSDEFYQLMLLCWQNDPDERPPFSEIESQLQRIAKDDVSPHLLFSLYASFSYESFSPHLEFLD